MALRVALLWEVVAMAFDTVRTNKLRSALTVLGVVIGITSIVGMTAMIRGFDQSLRSHRAARARHDHRHALQLRELHERRRDEGPDEAAEPDDLGRPLSEQGSDVLRTVDIQLGGQALRARCRGSPQPADEDARRHRHNREVPGRHEHSVSCRPILNGTEVQHRKNVAVLGNTAYKLLFEPAGTDPIGKTVRVGAERFEVVGVYDKRAAGGFGSGADEFVVIPYTTYQRIYGLKAVRVMRNGTTMPIGISIVPREGVPVKEAMTEVERIMRSRHGLKLDDPNDFEMLTQDQFLKLWNRSAARRSSARSSRRSR